MLRLLPAAACLLCPATARAQVLFGGGGRITIGAPTDFSVSAGHANYPGGGGFVPGYGYYPYYINGTERAPSIVITVPPKHGAPDFPPGPPPVAVEPPPGSAELRLRVPADAVVWFDGDPTAPGGEQRRFLTPALEPGKQYAYDVRVRWTEGGKPVERTERVLFYPGDRRTFDFTPPADTIPVLPAPRRVP
jgi:uncharacterized protein (TIGR03000 family)